jgi:hypothetical protein
MNNSNLKFQDIREMLNLQEVEKSIMIEPDEIILEIDQAKNQVYHHNFDKNIILEKIITFQKLKLF